MKKQDRLRQYLKDIGFISIQQHNETYRELGNRFNLSSESTRKICKKHERSLNLTLEQKVEAAGIDPSRIKRINYNPQKNSYSVGLHTQDDLTISNIKSAIQGVLVDNIPSFKDEMSVFPRQGKELAINITDVHVGMDNSKVPNVFQWNKESLFQRLSQANGYINEQLDLHNPSKIYLNFLGDMCDGQDGMTTRGRTRANTHILPQNMNNQEQIVTVIEFVQSLIYSLKGYSLEVNFVSNSNHGGILDFAVGNSLELFYTNHPNVEFNNLTDIFTYKSMGGFKSLYTHGNDEDLMTKFAKLPYDLKDRHILQIERELDLNKNNLLIRGDLHINKVTNHQNFDDIIVPAFSPSSPYIKSNFNNNLLKSGFTMLVLQGNHYDVITRYFD